jgi:hypothetical protein
VPTTAETLAALDRMRASVDGTVDGTTRALVKAWASAWQTLAGEWREAVTELVKAAEDGKWPTRSQINRAKAARLALAHSATALDGLGTLAGVTITGPLAVLVREADAWQQAIVRTQLPAGYRMRWTAMPDRTLDAIVRRTTEQVESVTRVLSRDVQAVMKQELVRGIAVGSNPRVAARKMFVRTRQAFDGGLWRAENLARTEMLDAHRAGSLSSRQANGDVVLGWQWLCSLSARTCPSCLAQHGSRHPADEPGPLDHQQGRCTALPLSRSWLDLGIDAPEPPPVPVQDSREWFDLQSADVRRQIMGPKRLALLDSGGLQWSELSRRKTNDNWRDSFAVPRLG